MCLYEETSAKLEISPATLLSRPYPPPLVGERSDERGMLINCFARISRCVETSRPKGTCRFSFQKMDSHANVHRASWPGEMRHNDRSSGMRHLHTFSSSKTHSSFSIAYRRLTYRALPIDRNFKCEMRSKDRERSLRVRETTQFVRDPILIRGRTSPFFFSLTEIHACKRITYLSVENFRDLSRLMPLGIQISLQSP